ncbi:MAG TPA: hypothetical protein VIM63_18120 [Rhodoferax sp.]
MTKFAELVAAKWGGKMQVKLLTDGILGSDLANISAIQCGVLDMAVMYTGILASAAKDLVIFDFPYLFANSKRPINKVEDIEGLKLRVILNPINVAWVKALGASPSPRCMVRWSKRPSTARET